jgi:Ecdysteroid kinase-like family
VDIAFICRPDDVTPEWLTAVLTAAGATDEGTVVEVESHSVGTGQVGDSVRFTLTWDEADAGPATVVGKFPTDDETSRATATAVRTYEVETRFYQQLRGRVDIAAPIPYYAQIDMATHDFAILMNDLAPAEQGDQIAGCTPDEAAIAVEEAAKLHAPLWGDSSLAGLDWLNRSSPGGLRGLVDIVWPGFLERYDGRLEPEVVAAGTALVENLEGHLGHRPEQLTAVHGDFRLDNMLFDPTPGGAPMTTVDWQTVNHGAGVQDVSYFLGTGLEPDRRAEVERDLVKEYLSTLRAGGVKDMTFEACWDQYRRDAFAGFMMAMISSMIVGQTARGDDMFMAMANRSGRMALDLETLSML